MQTTRSVMGGAELKIMGTFGDPGRVLEDTAVCGHKIRTAHLAGSCSALVRVQLGPMVGDLLAGGKPHSFVTLSKLQKAPQRLRASGAAHQAAMQPDGEHPGRTVTGDFPVSLLHRGNLLRRPREGGRHSVDGNRHFLDQPVQTPEPGARAIFVD